MHDPHIPQDGNEPLSGDPLAGLMREFNALRQQDIGAAIDAMFLCMDLRDGDPDLETDLSDYEPDADGRGDTSWTEWHTRGQHKLREGAEPGLHDRYGYGLHEDAEDDDPAEDDDSDRCPAGDDHIIAGPVAGLEWWGRSVFRQPGDDVDAEDDDPDGTMLDHGESGAWPEGFEYGTSAIEDDEHENDEPAARARHRNRIRRTRCDVKLSPIWGGGHHRTYTLRSRDMALKVRT